MNSIIRAEHLRREIITNQVSSNLINGVSLDIQESEFVVIEGPSGSGKSSLLYLLGLIDSPTSGNLWFNNINTSILSDIQRSKLRLSSIGFVFQFHFLLPEFSVLENIALPMKRLGRLNEHAISLHSKELLKSLGLLDHIHKKPNQLSGGQSQRVSIARALANNPKVILADEPTGNLDSVSSANVRDILKSLVQEQNCTVIIVTHDHLFAQMADRVIKIIDGQIVK